VSFMTNCWFIFCLSMFYMFTSDSIIISIWLIINYLTANCYFMPAIVMLAYSTRFNSSHYYNYNSMSILFFNSCNTNYLMLELSGHIENHSYNHASTCHFCIAAWRLYHFKHVCISFTLYINIIAMLKWPKGLYDTHSV
jgi:hypothetical protein